MKIPKDVQCPVLNGLEAEAETVLFFYYFLRK